MTQADSTTREAIPSDLLDYDEAALAVDRARNTVRAWVREGSLRSWSADPPKPNAKRLVSRSELMQLAASIGRALPAASSKDPESLSESATMVHELATERSRAASLESVVTALRGQVKALEIAIRSEWERGEAEKQRAADWRERASSLEHEMDALRAEAKKPWWKRLFGR